MGMILGQRYFRQLHYRPRRSLVRVLALTAAALALAISTSAAFARSGVSPRFDGHYRGAITRSDVSAKACMALAEVDDMRVVNGQIQRGTKIAADNDGSGGGPGWQFDGFITEEGFVSGHAQLPGGGKAPFEGRVQEEGAVATLVGGIVDEASGCSWLVRFDLD